MRNPFLVVFAAGALAVAGAACSGGGDASEASGGPQAEAPDARTSSPRLVTAEYRVDGMTCGGCAIATEMAVKELDGVESADAEYLGEEESGRCTVTYDPSVVGTESIASAIEGAGFEPSLTGTSSGPGSS